MTRMLSVLAGASLLALAGAANAGEPVTLTSAQMDDVTAGLGLRINKTINTNVNLRITAVSLVYGATAEADAEAFGSGIFGATSQSYTGTDVSSGLFHKSAYSTSTSISAAN